MTSSAPTLTENRTPALDPLSPVLGLGDRAVRVGIVIGIIGALLLHGLVGVRAATVLGDVHAFAVLVRAEVRERLSSQIDVDLSEPEPPPPPEPEAPPPPDPEPQPVQPQTAAPVAPTDAPPPPAAAEAGKVLTQDPDPNEPVDLTNDGFVSGTGDRFAGGVTASNGTSNTAVRDTRATGNGVGKAPPGPVATAPSSGPDLSRAAAPVATNWNCEFPAEADIEGIDNAVVMLTVVVSPDGRPKSVSVLRDPGNGFGQAARSCAFRRPFSPALDRGGNAITTSTAPFTVRFTR